METSLTVCQQLFSGWSETPPRPSGDGNRPIARSPFLCQVRDPAPTIRGWKHQATPSGKLGMNRPRPRPDTQGMETQGGVVTFNYLLLSETPPRSSGNGNVFPKVWTSSCWVVRHAAPQGVAVTPSLRGWKLFEGETSALNGPGPRPSPDHQGMETQRGKGCATSLVRPRPSPARQNRYKVSSGDGNLLDVTERDPLKLCPVRDPALQGEAATHFRQGMETRRGRDRARLLRWSKTQPRKAQPLGSLARRWKRSRTV